MDNADDELFELLEIIRKAVNQHDKRLKRLEAEADFEDPFDFDEYDREVGRDKL